MSKAPAAILFDINPLQTLFWKKFFKMLAEHESPKDFAENALAFIKDFYFDLSEKFNLKTLKENSIDFDSDSPDPSYYLRSAHGVGPDEPFEYAYLYMDEYEDINDPRCISRAEEQSSPIKNMSYKSFNNKIMGYLSYGIVDKEIQWLASEENYKHLHLMAKNKSLTAVTLDVADAVGFNKFKTILDKVTYSKINTEKGQEDNGVKETGAKIGNMYLSNVLYYQGCPLDGANEPEGTQYRFGGDEVHGDTYQKVLQNLRSITTDGTRVLRFDKPEPGFMSRPEYHVLFPLVEGVSIPQAKGIAGLSMT